MLQVLWDVASGQPICGSPAHNQNVSCVKFFRQSNTKIVTAGNYNLQVRRPAPLLRHRPAGTSPFPHCNDPADTLGR